MMQDPLESLRESKPPTPELIEQRKRMTKHLAAGAQISMARSSLSQLASQLEMMYGEDDAEAFECQLILQQMGRMAQRLTERLDGEVPPTVSERIIESVYFHTPFFMRDIASSSGEQVIVRYWLSQDNLRAAIACYLLVEAIPDKPGMFKVVGTVATPGQANEFNDKGTFDLKSAVSEHLTTSIQLFNQLQ